MTKLGIKPESPDSKIHALYPMTLHCQLDLLESISSAALDLTVERVLKVSVVQAPSNEGKRQPIKCGGRFFLGRHW